MIKSKRLVNKTKSKAYFCILSHINALWLQKFVIIYGNS